MLEKHISELAERSKTRQIFTYTDFVNPQTQSEIFNAYKSDFVSFWGGAEFAERKMARFGNAQEIAYKEDFPLTVLKITILNAKGERSKFLLQKTTKTVSGAKFDKPLTHRDVLGSIMACGVERGKVGDIFVGENIYAVVATTIAEHLLRELTQIGRSSVQTEITNVVDNSFAPTLKGVSVTAQSNRLDAIISKLYNLSRDDAAKLIELGKVYIDGANCDKCARPLKSAETVSVRGYGKFRFDGENGQSKKGKTYFLLNVYK